MNEIQTQQRSELKRLMNKSFKLDDIQDMAFEFDIDYESLAGDTKNPKIIALITKMEVEGRLDELIQSCQKRVPKELWPVTKPVSLSMERVNREITVKQSDTSWAGFLLDYSHRYQDGSMPSDDNFIEEICNECVAGYDLQPLLKSLEDARDYVRKFAAKAIGELGGRFKVEKSQMAFALINVVNDEDLDIETRRRVVWALGAIRPSHRTTRNKTRAVLRKLLIDKGEDVSVRWKAAWALGELRAKEEASILAHFAGNPNIDVNIRRAAMRSLGVLKAVKYREVVAEFTNPNGSKLERTAAWSKSEIDCQIIQNRRAVRGNRSVLKSGNRG